MNSLLGSESADQAGTFGQRAPAHATRVCWTNRATLRTRRCAYRTEQVYVDWVRRFILFHGQRHPRDMGAAKVTAFLSYLALKHCVFCFDAEPGEVGHLVLV